MAFWVVVKNSKFSRRMNIVSISFLSFFYRLAGWVLLFYFQVKKVGKNASPHFCGVNSDCGLGYCKISILIACMFSG